MAICCVLNCESKPVKSDITFHKFPIENESLLKIWLRNINQETWTPTSESKICSKHFHLDSFEFQNNVKVLKSSAIPLIQFENVEKFPDSNENSQNDELVGSSKDFIKELDDDINIDDFKDKDNYLEDKEDDFEDDDDIVMVQDKGAETDAKTQKETNNFKKDTAFKMLPTKTDITVKKVILKYDDYKKLTDPREKINCLRQIIGNQRRKIKTYYQHLRRRQLKIDNYEKLLINLNSKHTFNSELDMKNRTENDIEMK